MVATGRQPPSRPAATRIACLGGSTTYDDGVGDDDTYPLKLEQDLRAARPGRDIEVLNCGVPSYTSAESLANLSFRVLDLQPDAIVLYEGINDWRTRDYKNYDAAYFHFRKVWDGSARNWKAGAPGTEMAKGINPLSSTTSQPTSPQRPPNNGSPPTFRRNQRPAPSRNLRASPASRRPTASRVVMVSNTVDATNPYLPSDMLAGMAETNGVIREVCAAQHALFIDLDAQFPKGDQIPAGGLFVDIVHNNPAGSALKARIIADALLKDLLK